MGYSNTVASCMIKLSCPISYIHQSHPQYHPNVSQNSFHQGLQPITRQLVSHECNIFLYILYEGMCLWKPIKIEAQCLQKILKVSMLLSKAKFSFMLSVCQKIYSNIQILFIWIAESVHWLGQLRLKDCYSLKISLKYYSLKTQTSENAKR